MPGAARIVLVSGFAVYLVFAPAHSRASPLRGISPARWSARPPPPRGSSLSPRALVVGFCYSFSSCSRKEYEGFRPKGM